MSQPQQNKTIPATQLKEIYEDPTTGVVGLSGDRGNIAEITGEVYESNANPGLLVIETEHGSLYVDLEAELRITTDLPAPAKGTASLSAKQLTDLNDLVTGFLSDTFSWNANTEEDYDLLNDLTHEVGSAIAPKVEKLLDSTFEENDPDAHPEGGPDGRSQ